jgi:glycopeptide antibiotics resistance protein
MTMFVAWAGTSVGLAVLAGLALASGWLALRVAGVRRGTTLPDLLVALAVVVIVVLTLRPGRLGQPTESWQLLLFGDLIEALVTRPRAIGLALVDLAGNILLFLPLGAAIALRWPRVGELRAVVVAVVISLGIEITQWLAPLGRTAQTTDLLMNGLGAWLGWWLIVWLRRSALVSAAARRRR